MKSKEKNRKRRTEKEKILTQAERMQHFCDLLAEQCDSWLPDSINPDRKESRQNSEYNIYINNNSKFFNDGNN